MRVNSQSVPYHRQELESSCTAACVRMVMEFLGDVRPESDWRDVLGTGTSGTVAHNLMRLSCDEFEVYVRPLGFAELDAELEAGRPVIAFVWTGTLSHWSQDVRHALVVVGLDESVVTVHDPASGTGTLVIPRAEFEQAWGAMSYGLAIIRPRQKRRR